MKKSISDDVCEIHKTHPSALELARLHEADDETSLRLAEVFKVLGDRTRIKLLSLLTRKSSASATSPKRSAWGSPPSRTSCACCAARAS